jgi:hypothetical protein
MLDKLFDLVKGLAGNAVINNPEIPNEQNNAIVAEATHSVASGLQNELASGGLQNILSLFGSGDQQPVNVGSLMNNPIVSSMTGNFASNLMSKFGIGGTQASSVANSLIPNVLSGLINKTNDPYNSSFTLDKLLHSLTGGQSTQVTLEQQSGGNSGFSFQNLIGSLTPNGQQGVGGGGLTDIVSKITSGAQTAQQQGGGGMLDVIKGFF